MATVLVAGEALVDVVEGADGAVEEHPGGSPANVAVALARLGNPTVLATALGDDARGRLVADHLAGSGVVLAAGSQKVGRRTSSARARLDANGQATYTFDLAWEPDLAGLPEVDVLHVGSVSTTLEPGGSAVVALAREARQRSTISYDVNARPALMGSPGGVRERVEELASLADVVKASDEDLAWLYDDRPDSAARALLVRGPTAVVVTRGAEGATVFSVHGEVDVPAPQVTVADTIGAGDTFSAGLVHALGVRGLLGSGAREELRSLPPVSWHRVATYAARLAAVTASRPGADPPYLHETAGWPA